jgi:PAS domain S-box-containing protein
MDAAGPRAARGLAIVPGDLAAGGVGTVTSGASHPLSSLCHVDVQRFLEAVGSIAFVVDVLPDGCFLLAAGNQAFTDAVGHHRAVSGVLTADLFPGRDGFDLDTRLQRCVDARLPIAGEVRLPMGGDRRWWHLTLSPLGDRTDHVTRLLGIALDITGRKREEESLRLDATLLRDAIEAMAEGFALWDRDERLVFCNDRFRQCYPAAAQALAPAAAFGDVFADAAAAGWLCREAAGDRDAEMATPTLRPLAAEREEGLSDGRWLLATDRATPDGGTVSFRTDITDRKRIERVVRQSRATLQAMMDSVDDLIAMVNADHLVLAVNRAGARWLGSEPSRVVGRRIDAVFDAETGTTIGHLIDEVLGGGVTRHAEVSTADRCLEVSLHPVPGADAAPVAVSVVGRDVTRRKAAEHQVREHQQLLARCQRITAVGETAAALAHEVSQPLAAVVNYCAGARAQLNRGAFSAADLADALGDACHEAERAQAIVRGMTGFVRRTPENRSRADVNAVIGGVVDLIRRDLERHDVELRLALAQALPAVEVNVVEVEQVVFNLLRNSLDSLVDGRAAARRINVATALVDGPTIEIRVDDSGPGFSPEARSKLFTPFHTTKARGMGMGLAICRTIVEGHGGRIWVADSPEGGASVRFTLPLGAETRLAS